MSNDKLAFFIGLLGSLHCVGMCGPLAFALPINRRGFGCLLWNKFIYQFGRILTYCLLGLVVGLMGKQIWQLGLQQGVSLLTGVMILLAGLSRLLKFKLFEKSPAIFLKPFHKLFNYAFKHKSNHLIIGVINGLLPCGFVYLALAGAMNTGSIYEAISYMFWFGAGTTPLMFAAAVIAGISGMAFRKKLNNIIPYTMICIGIWFVIRGLELNVPYLSPQEPTGLTLECK